jgi:hypothetical protein
VGVLDLLGVLKAFLEKLAFLDGELKELSLGGKVFE